MPGLQHNNLDKRSFWAIIVIIVKIISHISHISYTEAPR